MERADDRSIRDFAAAHDYNIVTKDDDSKALLRLLGHPPRLIRLRMGNCRNTAVLEALVGNCENIRMAFQMPDIGMVEIG